MKRLVSSCMKSMRQTCYLMIAVLSFLLASGSVDVFADTYEYDALSRVTKVIYEDGSYTTYTYDANGNVISQHYQKKEDTKEDTSKPGSGSTTGGSTGTNIGGNKPSSGQSGTSQSKKEPAKGTTTKKPVKKVHKKGMTAKTSNATYVITSVKKKTVTFQKFRNKKKTSYTIPKYVKIDGIKYKVTKIAAKAFKNNKKIKKITISSYVTSIGKEAFYKCKKLKTITIKTTKLKTVGKNAFKGIYKKAKIKVPKKKYKKYKKLLKGKGQKKTVKIKKGL